MENPQEWKSAVDPTSGRTYWYHRKTRVSTWVKPNFFPDPSEPAQGTSATTEQKQQQPTSAGAGVSGSESGSGKQSIQTQQQLQRGSVVESSSQNPQPSYQQQQQPATSQASNNSNTTSSVKAQTTISGVSSNPTYQQQSQSSTTTSAPPTQQQSKPLSLMNPNALAGNNTQSSNIQTTNRGAASAVSPNNELRFIPSDDEAVNIDKLKRLLYSITTTADEVLDESMIRNIRKSPLIISDLSKYVTSACAAAASGNTRITAMTMASRLYALQILVNLSNIRILACTAFHTNQSWLTIITSVSSSCGTKSGGNSGGSTTGNKTLMILLQGLVIQLLVGPTASLVPATSSQLLLDEAWAMLSSISDSFVNNNAVSTTAMSPLSWEDLQLFTEEYFIRLCSILSSKGHSVAAMLILTLAFQALNVEKVFTKLVRNGIVGAIQSICVSAGIETEIRSVAKKCLQHYLSSSDYVRDMLLDSYLNMTFELSQVAVPVGTSMPSIYSTLELEEVEETFQVMMESGCFDVPDLTPGETLFNNSFGNRDIVWMPKSGASWKLNSIILWSRCPALRELIQDFWGQGGGSLELSIDASDEVVYCVCQYIHSGMVNLPIPQTYQLELLRVASELGMPQYQALLESAIGHLVNHVNVNEILEFSHSYGFEDLAVICERFMEYNDGSNRGNSMAFKYHPKPIRLNSNSGGNSSVLNGTANNASPGHHFNLHQGSGGGHGGSTGSGAVNSSTLALEHAVMQSLNDVGDLLNETSRMNLKSKGASGVGQQSVAQQRPMQNQTDRVPSNTMSGRGQSVSGTSASHAMATSHTTGDYDDDYDYEDYLDEVTGGRGTRTGSGGDNDFQSGRSSFDSDHYSGSGTGNKKADQRGGSSSGGGKPKMGGIYSALLQGKKNTGGFDVSEPMPSKGPAKSASSTAGSKVDPKAKSKKDNKSATHEFDFDLDLTSNGPMEFNHDMSLKPRRAKTESEKRLEEMSKPRHLREQKPKKSVQDDELDNKLDGEDSQELPAASTVAPAKPGSKATGPAPGAKGKGTAGASSAPVVAAVAAAQPTAALANGPPSRPGASAGPPKKTAVVNTAPSSSAASTVAPTIQVKSIHHPNQDSEPNNEGGVPPVSVRSSLTLLKNKTPKARRRASVSAPAVEDDQQAPPSIQSKLNYGYGEDNDSDAFTPPNVASSSGSRPGTASNPANRGISVGGRPNTTGGGGFGGGVRNSYDEPSYYEDEQEEEDDPRGGFRPNTTGTTRGGPTQSNMSSANGRGGSGGGPMGGNGFRGRQPEPEPEPEEEEDDEYADYGRGGSNSGGFGGYGNSSYGYDEQDEEGMGMDGPQEGFMECPDCGRHFAPEPFSRHVRICKKVFVNKRKVFDSSKKRIEAIPELKSLLDSKKRNKRQSAAAQQPPKSNKWKEQSMAFREAMRAAREYANGGGGNNGGDVVVERKPYVDPSLIECPNCQRRFNDKAAERHIPICKNIIAKPSSLKKGSGTQASTQQATGKPSGGTMKKGWN